MARGREKKWNWRHAAAACRQFHFFSRPTSGRFHNFMPVFTHETISQFHFLSQIKQKKNHQFHPVFTWNCATIKNKNKWGLQLKPHFLHKTGHKISCPIWKNITHNIPRIWRSKTTTIENVFAFGHLTFNIYHTNISLWNPFPKTINFTIILALSHSTFNTSIISLH